MKIHRALLAALGLIFLLAGLQAQQRPNAAPPQPRHSRSQAPAAAEPVPPPPVSQGSPQYQQMAAKLDEMTRRQRETIDQINKADASLQKRLDAMNAARGEQKAAAMADVINELAQDRKQLHNQVLELQKALYEQSLTQINMLLMTGDRAATPSMRDGNTSGTKVRSSMAPKSKGK